jgi:recombinational DNA repair protein (RecF pathway)
MCAGCRTPQTGLTISPASLGALATRCQGTLIQWLAGEKASAGGREARRFFEELIESHLERKLVTRELLAEEV